MTLIRTNFCPVTDFFFLFNKMHFFPEFSRLIASHHCNLLCRKITQTCRQKLVLSSSRLRLLFFLFLFLFLLMLLYINPTMEEKLGNSATCYKHFTFTLTTRERYIKYIMVATILTQDNNGLENVSHAFRTTVNSRDEEHILIIFMMVDKMMSNSYYIRSSTTRKLILRRLFKELDAIGNGFAVVCIRRVIRAT